MDEDDSNNIEGKKNVPKNVKKNENHLKNHKQRFRQKHENVKKGRLIIRNLSFNATEESLSNQFKQFGNISEVNILKKPDGKLIGCAFIQFENYQDSVKAIQNMNGKAFLQRKISVDFAVSKNRYKNSHKSDEPEVKTEEEAEIKEEIKEETDDEAEVKEESEEVEDESDEEKESEDEDDDQEEEDSKEVKPVVKQERRSNEEDNEYTIFIKNLSFDTTNENLQECFKKFGPIKYALVVRDPVSGHSKGTGFVRFLKKESVNLSLQQTGLITLQNFTLEVFPSLSKQKIQSLELNKKNTEPKDSRNMYLLREGMVLAGSAAADGVSATDMSKRLRLEQVKSSMLKNLNRFISRDRLTIHNLPEAYDDEKLRKVILARTGLKPMECRIMRENKPTPAHPKGKSKGFGFLSFKKHEDALSVLRKLNNNPDVFSANHRPIVSFSIEDKKVLNIKERREQRSKLNNPTYQKKLEKMKMKKKAKKLLKGKMDKKPVQVKTPAKKPSEVDQEASGSFSGFSAKPGPLMKLRGTFKLKEQSKIHEKSMHDRNKKARREKQMAEARQEKAEKKSDRQTKKRKIDAGTRDSLSKMIDKYKNMIKGNDDGPENKKAKTRGKWFME